MDNTRPYAVLSGRTDRCVRNRIRLRITAYEASTTMSKRHHAEPTGGTQSLSSRPGVANIIPKDMRKTAGSSAQWLRGRGQYTAELSIICRYPQYAHYSLNAILA